MYFSSLPEAYAPLFPHCFCTLSEVAAPRVTVRIFDEEGHRIGAKTFSDSDSVTFDLTPYLGRMARYTPRLRNTSVEPSERLVRCYLEAETDNEIILSESLCLLPASVVTPSRLCTTLPTDRTIAPDGVDWLTIRTDSPLNIQVAGYVRGEEVETLRFVLPEAGLYDLMVNAADFDGVDELAVLLGGQMAVGYLLRTPPRKATTLAWRSACGSIEHYTFPRRVSVDVEVERTTGYGKNGYETAHTERNTLLTLDSAPESEEVARALSELLSAEEVWQLTEAGYEARRIVTKRWSWCDCGAVATLRVVVADNNKEGELWSC